MITALVAVWWCGAAYLPLDPAYPPARLGYMLADSRAAVVVSTGQAAGELPAGRGRVIVLDDPVVRATLGAAVPAAPARVHPAQAAYLIYTSGSTGAPKGVVVTHGALEGYLSWCRAGPGWAGAGGTRCCSRRRRTWGTR